MTNVDPSPSEHPEPTRPVWEQVLDEIRRLIVLGELAPGERLVETSLAHHFGVSRGPVRTAILTLEKSGLVRASERRGVEVADFTSADVAELFAVRTALEAFAVRLAAERSTPRLVARLQSHLDALRGYRERGLALEAAEADLAFHEEICASCGIHLLLVTWTNLADATALVMTRMHRSGHAAPDELGHQAILEAIASGDPDEAERALRRHLDTGSSRYQEAQKSEAERSGRGTLP